MIYNKENILTTTIVDTQTTYILKDNTYIGNSFKWLPNGRIDKRVTGIGATHCELVSKRNSIILEPLRSIASSKAIEHNAIYVGGKTNKQTNQIKNAIKECTGFIKIVVVADSLWKVLEAINPDPVDDEDEIYHNYFFMVDEIDTFQTESDYRHKLEMVMDYYFKFKNRCVVSATLREFSNPKLIEEPLSIFDYSNLPKKEITLTIGGHSSIDSIVAALIQKCLKDNQPVLVAYNYVIGILNVIEKLPDELKLNCRILCSSDSKNKVGDYYIELNSNELHHPITFVTSAYFSGIDINTRSHMICVAIGVKAYTLLSIDRLKQIQGRLRNGFISNHLICSIYSGFVPERLTKEYVLRSARKTLKALECVQKVYSDDKGSGQLMDKVRAGVSKGATIYKYKLVRKDREKYLPAYFNIDALLLYQTTLFEMYMLNEDMKSQIEENYELKSYFELTLNIEDSTIDKVYENQQELLFNETESMLEFIEKEDNELDYKTLLKEATSQQKKILQQYRKAHELLSKNDSLSWIRKLNIKENKQLERDSRKFNNFYTSLLFEALVNEHVLKVKLCEMFPIGSEHTKQEILIRLNSVYSNADIGISKVNSHTQAMRALKCYFVVKNTRRKDQNEHSLHAIRNFNPKELTLTKKLGEDLKANEMFNGLTVRQNLELLDPNEELGFIDFMHT